MVTQRCSKKSKSESQDITPETDLRGHEVTSQCPEKLCVYDVTGAHGGQEEVAQAVPI